MSLVEANVAYFYAKKQNVLLDGLNFKQKKALKDKAQAGSSHNWNSLFMGHNAVADVIADNYNTSKEHVLDGRGKGSAAVRLALGETQIIAQTKQFLEDSGVLLDAFNQVFEHFFIIICSTFFFFNYIQSYRRPPKKLLVIFFILISISNFLLVNFIYI